MSSTKNLPIKEKYKLERIHMPEADPKVRATNFSEVNLGLPTDIAMAEAGRCIQCKKPVCIDDCPVHINIPKFLELIADGDAVAAAADIKKYSSLPGVCGRVCPQEKQCEKNCVMGKKKGSIAIGWLERFASDAERADTAKNGFKLPPVTKTGKRVAVIGSGPAGLTVAGDMAKFGHEVTVYEALHKAGGVLVYGIPDFRLPKEVFDFEIEYLKALGVKFQMNTIVGASIQFDDLQKNFDAIFMATGAGLPWFLGIPGENLCGVFSANEFLTRIILMKGRRFPEFDTPVLVKKKVAIIGCGDTAMDACRSALRLGPEKVMVIYRRSAEEAPAREEEFRHAQEEGIEFNFLTNPLGFVGENGWLKKVQVEKMELGEPDPSGRRSVRAIPNSKYEIDVDIVVEAIGFGTNPLLVHKIQGLKLGKKGNVEVDWNTMATSVKGLYAGGDAIVPGGSNVIMSMGHGQIAAKAMNEYLKSN